MMTGRAVGQGLGQGMGQHMQDMLLGSFGMELIYSVTIILCSLLIYFGTKELYQLSQHKGIKYFRLAFLFFAIAYFFRFFIKFVIVYFNVPRVLDLSPMYVVPFFGEITIAIFMYFSTLAILSLLYSVKWKKTNEKGTYLVFNLISLLVAVAIISFDTALAYLIINLILLIPLIILFNTSRKSKTKKSKANLHIIYTLLGVFWILNILDVLIPDFFRTFQILFYLVSEAIFMIMLYKVLRKTGV